jgi:hypothetical protein
MEKGEGHPLRFSGFRMYGPSPPPWYHFLSSVIDLQGNRDLTDTALIIVLVRLEAEILHAALNSLKRTSLILISSSHRIATYRDSS